jgi:hypothetical protein
MTMLNAGLIAMRGLMPLWVVDRKDASANFMLLATTAAHRSCLRVAGGCSGMDEADKAEMLEFFAVGLSGFRGMIWSGATRQMAGGEVDPMVTEVPGLIAGQNPGCVALGTAPRTGTMHLERENSRFDLDGEGTLANTNLSGMMVIQDGPDAFLGWDGDLDPYFAMMSRLQSFAGFSAVGLVAWNGGGVTEKEILRSAALGWPTMLVKGSGRKTDEIAARLDARDPSLLAQLPQGHRLRVIDRKDPAMLRIAMLEHGFTGNQVAGAAI